MNNVVLRLKANIQATAIHIHLIMTAVFAIFFGWLIFYCWFEYPYFLIADGWRLFFLILLVSFFSGPFLTLIVFDARKSLREIRFDLCFVGLIQLAALVYGLYSIAQARPIALVLEIDRFHLVTNADIDSAEITLLPSWAHPFSFSKVQVLGIRVPSSEAERAALLESALQGIEPGQKPSWWRKYDQSVSNVNDRGGSLKELLEKNPLRAEDIKEAASRSVKNPQEKETADASALKWFPIIGRKSISWIALVDPETARIRGFLEL